MLELEGQIQQLSAENTALKEQMAQRYTETASPAEKTVPEEEMAQKPTASQAERTALKEEMAQTRPAMLQICSLIVGG